jgi:hypothetical protein
MIFGYKKFQTMELESEKLLTVHSGMEKVTFWGRWHILLQPASMPIRINWSILLDH